METWELILLFSSSLLGGLGIFLFKKDNSNRLKLVLSFSGAYLFAITVLHLMPDVYSSGNPQIGLYILGGFLLQILMEQFSEGIEHGHIHKHSHKHYIFPFGIMISLCLHAFLEGMPLAQGQHKELVYGIALHHIPAAFALGSVLLENKLSKGSVTSLLILFALMSPLGYWLSFEIGQGSIGNIEVYFDRIMGVVIGIFLHISTTILFESSVDHKFNLKKIVAVLLGVSIALAGFFMH
ncbi:Zinc transporter ZupT [Daejeonella rubra]|uniref:Zinc transporter ZupT n=1 Tax=Daejeonella rubra TaxID=990371 RepID=A0A1G9QGA2_9SPHI|nr:ZIP family metal transporter [Daejeonella rubra]SDM10124.1 Zinc transporter ZupT [Daejeonella rubra]